MAEQLIQIRSVKQYVKDFLQPNITALNSPMRRAQIKMQILDAFRKEVFEQIVGKFGADVLQKPRDEMAGLDGIQNILNNSFRKWRRLCILCNEAGLINWLTLDDLKQILEEKEHDDAHLSEVENKDGRTFEETSEAV